MLRICQRIQLSSREGKIAGYIYQQVWSSNQTGVQPLTSDKHSSYQRFLRSRVNHKSPVRVASTKKCEYRAALLVGTHRGTGCAGTAPGSTVPEASLSRPRPG